MVRGGDRRAPTQHDIRVADKSFILRIAPYAHAGISGTVLTFTNVPAFRASIDQAVYEREYAKATLNTVVVLERVRRGERVEPYDTVRRRKDGSLVEIFVTISPARDADGRIVGTSKIARDVTDRKRAEEALRLLAHEVDHRSKNC